MTRLLFLLLAIFGVACDADEKPWQTFDKWENWPEFRVPSSFTQDKKSFEGEGYKWVVIYNHPDGEFSVYASPYGYISEVDRHEYGFQSPRDVLLVYELRAGVKVEMRDGFEVFTQDSPTSTDLWFLMKNPEFGNCYDSLHFSYPEGQKSKYAKTIDAIVKSFRPSFAKGKKSAEQDGAEQPATAPESKPEGDQNLKPESEGRSQ